MEAGFSSSLFVRLFIINSPSFRYFLGSQPQLLPERTVLTESEY